MSYKLTISVVLFNTDEDEILNIIEIISGCKFSTKLFFIDNSPNNNASKIVGSKEGVEYIHTGENLGFGKGHNIAIDFAKDNSEFHLILNADVDFDSSVLEDMLRYMELNQSVGLMAPKVLNPDGSLQHTARLLPTPFYLIFRRFIPLNSIKERLNQKYELKAYLIDRPIEIPFFIGCFLLVRSSVLKKTGGYDPRYFMYMEDIDLVRRIYRDYKTVYYPLCSIIHKHGKGSYVNRKLLKYHLKSSVQYFNKWGWIFDRERKRINDKTLDQLK
ncbi:glycosyltransferase [Maribacter sp. MAR_2009_72]|uniref:glycosyltransferase n=1 Tax=Maribacter sp. MAR_2009_72 TaxID=1250050 RepID=UPI00119AF291|nr:glycosyltransferase family 2 protein [Maribacter sp. MAR_2009_72]TVZ16181.1 hypothetical protein JM81_2436 [Maribacter sp. MAR_2009_72]